MKKILIFIGFIVIVNLFARMTACSNGADDADIIQISKWERAR